MALPLMSRCRRTTACSVSSRPASGQDTVGVGGRGTGFSTRSRNLRGFGGSWPERGGGGGGRERERERERERDYILYLVASTLVEEGGGKICSCIQCCVLTS